MKTSLLSHTTAALREKLRQHRLTAALSRSKLITKSPTPVMDAIAAEAKLRGVSCDDLVGDWIAGKTALPMIDALVKPIATAAKPTVLQAAWDKGLAKGKPEPMTALSTYRKLEHSDPVAASKFYAQNKDEILRLAGLSDILKSR